MIIAHCDWPSPYAAISCEARIDGYHFKDLRELLNANGWKYCRSNSRLPLIEYLYCNRHAEMFEKESGIHKTTTTEREG